MIDYHADLVEALNTVLPTHYEMQLKQGTKTPCLSYQENNNFVSLRADCMSYNKLSYTVKVWANSIADIQKYALQVDEVLRPLGWVRTSSGELYDNQSTMIQKIMNYEALALETY